jgi:hypothetical protein
MLQIPCIPLATPSLPLTPPATPPISIMSARHASEIYRIPLSRFVQFVTTADEAENDSPIVVKVGGMLALVDHEGSN